jgi:CBS domain-containing protein
MSRPEIIRVRHIMQRQFDIVDGMASVEEALANMKYPMTRCLIVDKRHIDDEFGILLLSDIARKVLALDRAMDRVNVYEVMEKPIIGVDPNMDIRYCARLFDRFKISRSPVVEHGKVVGVVGFTDMVIKGMRQIALGDEQPT